MPDVEGAGSAGPQPLTITAGGITVRMLPVGWSDLAGIPREYDRIMAMDLSDPEAAGAFPDALIAFGDRIDAYAVGDPKPSRVPPADMLDFITRWLTGVRDAAVPPASAGGSRKRPSTTPRGSRR